MRSNKQFYTSKGSNQVGLYSFVFTKRISIFAIAFLFASFLVQPFHQALANEVAAEESIEPVLPDEVAEQLPDAMTEPTVTSTENEPDTEPVTTENSLPEETDTQTETDESETTNEEPPISEEEGVDDNATSSPDTTEEATSDPNDNATSTDEIPQNDTASSTEDTGNATSSDEQTSGSEGNSASSTNETTDTASSTPVDSTASSTATTSDDGTSAGNEGTNDSTNDNPPTDNSGTTDSEVVDNDSGTTTEEDLIDNEVIREGVDELVDEVVNEVVNITRQLVTEENYYQFSRQSCVAVGDGTYHCTTKEATAVDPDSAVYAEPDNEGDMEIYLRTSQGEIKQLTDNSFDDTSPDLDLASMRVVWQRLIDGRYQVISYDLEEREETQLTFSRNNSMEPKVAIEGIVWQAWDGNDWEIMHFDGQFTEQITNNDGIQDVTPVIEDGYILWSVIGGAESEARVYSIESGERMTITGHEGGTVANPRFVLVYDSKFENGDVITVGFDPVTGLAQPVSAKPAELPFDIPEPDPIGEIRALINNKSTTDENEIVVVPTADEEGDLNLAPESSSSSTTLSLDSVDIDGELVATTTEPDIELDEYDLVITDTASSTESAVNDDFTVSNLVDTASGTAATSTQS